MPHVVTRSCCADASCVYACPVNCIHPTPDEPDFATAEMLYIDPQSCVDCGACVRACPVGAIKPGTSLTEADLPFADLNAMFHQPPRSYPPQAPVAGVVRLERPALRVAVVGSGPAALYAADELLKQRGVEVTVIDRQPTPYGLARAGVAPDHPDTKQIERLFGQIERERGFSYLLGVDVGHDVTDEELAAHHHAVVYATGASRDRRFGIPGEDLPGSATATDFVAWYNGHLDHLHDSFDLANERVVVVGNGNVALDVARILATDPERLAGTDIADHALAALRDADVREVLVLGRRGPAQAAFTMPELLGLVARDDIDIELQGVLDSDEGPKVDVLRAAAARPRRADRRIVFRFRSAPLELTGSGRLDGLRVARTDLVTDQTGRVTAVPTDDVEQLATGLVLRSVGYRGVPVADLPFDDDSCVVPNVGGRVVAPSGEQLAGRYVVGWIKRGPTGFIGTNKSCSLETVNNLLIDHGAGLLPEPAGSSAELADLVRSRVPDVVDLAGWRLIDAAERERGLAEGRPRRKFASRGELAAVAQAGRAHASRARRRVVVTGR